LNDKIIYEKHYPKLEFAMMESADDSQNEISLENKPENLSFEQILEKIYKDVVYILLPERQLMAKEFLRKAINISNIYELDVKIRQHFDHITVNYYFNCAGCMGFLKEIIAYSDDIAFFNNIDGFEIVLSLDFYTHAVYRKDRRIKP